MEEGLEKRSNVVVQEIVVVSADHLTEIFLGDSRNTLLAEHEITDDGMKEITMEKGVPDRMN